MVSRRRYAAAVRYSADARARAIVQRLVQLGPVRGAQSQVAREFGVSKSTTSRALLRLSAGFAPHLDPVSRTCDSGLATAPSTAAPAATRPARNDPAQPARKTTTVARRAVVSAPGGTRLGQDYIETGTGLHRDHIEGDVQRRAAVRAALGITPPPRRTRMTKAQRRAAILADCLARWSTDTRTPEQRLADARMVPPGPAEQRAEGLELLASRRRADEQWRADHPGSDALQATLRAGARGKMPPLAHSTSTRRNAPRSGRPRGISGPQT